MSTLALAPVPGFCIKSVTPPGCKVFVNIAWDNAVPQPPLATEQRIHRAIHADALLPDPDPDAWYVPVVVSDPRHDTDKAGKPALVFDCIYNASLRQRSLTDPEFKLFLIELALQRIEAQSSLVLSRHIATPNIPSKGKLLPRTVSIPASLCPTWSWSWSTLGSHIYITISVPNLPPAVIQHATLDIEPRRFILHVPDHPVLDVNLALPDPTTPNALSLSRHRPLDVDRASSEWRLAENILLIVA